MSIKLLSSLAIVLSLTLCACQAELDSEEPVNLDGRYAVTGGKADDPNGTIKLDERFEGSGGFVDNFVLRMRAPSARRVGIAYSYTSYAQSSSWRNIDAYYTTDDIWEVRPSIRSTLQDTDYVRYAIYLVDASGQWTWLNNGGNDFYAFNNSYGGPVTRVSTAIEEHGHRFALTFTTANLGRERVFVAYTTNARTWFETEARWINGLTGYDQWIASIPVDIDVQEVRYAIRVEAGSNVIWANNFGHDFHSPGPNPHTARVHFTNDGYEVTEGILAPGRLVTIDYDRAPLCNTCYQSACIGYAEAAFRLYDDSSFWTASMQTQTNMSEFSTPEFWIPLDATKLELWFHHTGQRPPCDRWDSNEGANYQFEL